MLVHNRTWGYGVGPKILIGAIAAFMYGMAALIVSIPWMSGMAYHASDWIIYLTGAIMLGFALFMTVGLIAVVRTRIGLDATTLTALVPESHNWLLVPRFRTIALPVTEIRSVERRQEVFRNLGLSNLRESLSVVTTGGERIGLFSNTAGPAQQLPIDEIAGAIAAAAGVVVTDDGTVLTKSSGLYGQVSSNWTEQPLGPQAATEARRTVARTMQILVSLTMLCLILRACT